MEQREGQLRDPETRSDKLHTGLMCRLRRHPPRRQRGSRQGSRGPQRSRQSPGCRYADGTPCRTRDEVGTQDPGGPSGQSDVQGREGQHAEAIDTVGVLTGSRRVYPPPNAGPRPLQPSTATSLSLPTPDPRPFWPLDRNARHDRASWLRAALRWMPRNDVSAAAASELRLPAELLIQMRHGKLLQAP